MAVRKPLVEIGGQIQDLPSADSIALPLPTGKSVFFDAIKGNDSTGLRERFDLPFLTFDAASTAALAGDAVYILSDFTLTAAFIAKTGVNYVGVGKRVLTYTGVGGVTVWTMAETSFCKDIDMVITPSSSGGVTAVVFGGTTNATSQWKNSFIRGTVFNVNGIINNGTGSAPYAHNFLDNVVALGIGFSTGYTIGISSSGISNCRNVRCHGLTGFAFAVGSTMVVRADTLIATGIVAFNMAAGTLSLSPDSTFQNFTKTGGTINLTGESINKRFVTKKNTTNTVISNITPTSMFPAMPTLYVQGQTVKITCIIEITPAGSGRDLTIYLYRDGGLVAGTTYRKRSLASDNFNTKHLHWTDTPGSGTYQYDVRIIASGTGVNRGSNSELTAEII